MVLKEKLLTAAVTAVISITSTNVLAASNWDGTYHYANGFWMAAYTNKTPIIQKSTGLNTSCGPTSLLFADLYFSASKDNKIPEHLKTTEQVQAALKRLYGRLGKSEKSSYTTLDELNTLAKGWGWESRRRFTSSSVNENMNLLIQDLKDNALAIVAVRAGYRLNPVGNYGHIMIVYGYEYRTDEYGRKPLDPQNTRNNDVLKLFDPYFGGFHEFPRKDVTSSGSNGAFDLVNFAYLKVKR